MKATKAMASPFPGMDPYLESAEYWRSVHSTLIVTMTEQLNRSLPPGYVARPEARVYLALPDRSIYPDVALFEQNKRPLPAGGTAVVERPKIDAPEIVIASLEEIEEPYIEIRSVGSPKRVVTIIELLSPANKQAEHPGQRDYLQKQAEIRASDVHLLEIDLLRQGDYVLSVPRAYVAAKGRWDYLVCLNRAFSRQRFAFWRIGLQEPLPRIAVPLFGDDPDVPLDLQAAFTHCYEACRFADEIDYVREANPPLKDENAAWADVLLREKGLRS